jgi:amidophosphoribosyltransferase
LIGALKTIPEIQEFLGVESLGYLSIDGLLAAEHEPKRFCRACFTGHYPVAIDPSASKLGIEKQTREGVGSR